MTVKTKTGYYVPVMRDEPEEHLPDPEFVAKVNGFALWFLGSVAVAGVGLILWGGSLFGWFETPNQRLASENQNLQQQITAQNSKLEALTDKQTKLNQCFKEFSK